MAGHELRSLVDLDRYPIDRPGTPSYQAAVDRARDGLRSAGCAVIKDLVRPDAVRLLSTEIVQRKATTHYSHQTINPYFHVLEAGRDGVVTLDLRPGDLQIFRGRHSLHAVTRVPQSSQPRHAAIFAYTEQPGVIGRVVRTRQLFGRVLPAHQQAERDRVRSDALID